MAANNSSGTLMAVALVLLFYYLFVKNQLKAATTASLIGAPTVAGPAGFSNPNLQFAFVGDDLNTGAAELANKSGVVMSAADFAADLV